MKKILLLTLGILLINTMGLVANDSTGGISGTVRLAEDPPALPQITVEKNISFCGETLTDRILSVENRRVQGAVISLDWERETGIQDNPPSSISLQGQGCQFQPRIQATDIGNYLLLKSNDKITHNPHGWWNNKKTVFNITLLNPNQQFKRKLQWTGVYRVECDTHTWMKAYILVFNHPFYAVTDRDGSFKLENIPAGTYKIRVWHEILGEQTATVIVEAEEETHKDFLLPLMDKRPKNLIPKTVSPWPPKPSKP